MHQLGGVQIWWGVSWADWLIAFGTCVAALGFVAAAIGTFLAWRGLKENSKGRHAQIAIDLGRRWDAKKMAAVRQVTAKFSASDLLSYYKVVVTLEDGKLYAQVEAFANFFEDLGVLNKLNILSTEWINETLGSAVLGYWAIWSLVAIEARRDPANAKLYENWEILAEKIWTLRRELL